MGTSKTNMGYLPVITPLMIYNNPPRAGFLLPKFGGQYAGGVRAETDTPTNSTGRTAADETL